MSEGLGINERPIEQDKLRNMILIEQDTLNTTIPKEIKHKKGIPTVIEYQGRRYVLDHKHK